MKDPVRALTHDHADLNRRVLALGVQIQAFARSDAFVGPLRELREHLFLHFAREEEGLFPFVVDSFADLADRVHAMALAHDAICGLLARMCDLALAGAVAATLAPLFERFEHAYAAHARAEAALLEGIDARLDREQRLRLRALVEGL